MGKYSRKRKFVERDTSLTLYGEDGEQIKQGCIIMTYNILPTKVVEQYSNGACELKIINNTRILFYKS